MLPAATSKANDFSILIGCLIGLTVGLINFYILTRFEVEFRLPLSMITPIETATSYCRFCGDLYSASLTAAVSSMAASAISLIRSNTLNSLRDSQASLDFCAKFILIGGCSLALFFLFFFYLDLSWTRISFVDSIAFGIPHFIIACFAGAVSNLLVIAVALLVFSTKLKH